MKTSEIITEIKNALSLGLPAILSASGISDFDAYTIGYPTDQAKLFCCIRYNRGDKSYGAATFVFTVHLQLPGVDEETSYKYLDAVCEYLNDFETTKYGYYKGEYEIEMLENFRVADNQIFFDYTMTDGLDDCQ